MYTSNSYQNILVSVERFSGYPAAVIHTNCDGQMAIEFLKQYCAFHSIPRSIRCDQAEAFQTRTFELFCKHKDIKLIFSPINDQRGSEMVGRLIQTLKTCVLFVMHEFRTLWDSISLSEKTQQ